MIYLGNIDIFIINACIELTWNQLSAICYIQAHHHRSHWRNMHIWAACEDNKWPGLDTLGCWNTSYEQCSALWMHQHYKLYRSAQTYFIILLFRIEHDSWNIRWYDSLYWDWLGTTGVLSRFLFMVKQALSQGQKSLQMKRPLPLAGTLLRQR